MTAGDPRGPLGGIPLARSHAALKTLTEASAAALMYFEREDYDTAAAEVARCRKAMNTLAAIRREQKEER